MLGIIGAMDEEVEIIKADMTDVSVMVRAGMEFCLGKLGGKPVVVVKSGIGKVNAGMCAQILADVYAAFIQISGSLDAFDAQGGM